MKLAKLSILILVLQSCGESSEPEWSLSTGKGEAGGVAGRDAPCDEVNKVDGDLICTGQIEIEWQPSTWRSCHCVFDGQPVYVEGKIFGKFHCCNRPTAIIEGEGTPCDEIGDSEKQLTCTAVKKLVIVPHKWTDKDDYLCRREVDGEEFFMSDGATFAHSAWSRIEIVDCGSDGLLTNQR